MIFIVSILWYLIYKTNNKNHLYNILMNQINEKISRKEDTKWTMM